MLASLIAFTGIGAAWFSHIIIIAAIMVAIGTGIIGFVWGYIGAMEDERSHER